jgi:L-fuculose-phosphate aldolase
MNHQRYRIADALCAAGRRLDALGLVPARDGNLSARIGRDRLLVTPTGVRKRELTPDRLVEVDLSGTLRGSGKASSELGMHLIVYRLREDVEAVVHAHPPTALGFACAGRGLTDCLMPEVAVALGAVPLTPYATPGTPELEEAIRGSVLDHDAFLLQNHGAVTMGSSVDQALDRMETLEHFAKVALAAELLGGVRPLGPREVEALQAIRERMGETRPVTCAPSTANLRAAAASSPPVPEDRLAERVAEAIRAVLGDAPRKP